MFGKQRSPVRFKQASLRVGVAVAAALKAGRGRYRAQTVAALLLLVGQVL